MNFWRDLLERSLGFNAKHSRIRTFNGPKVPAFIRIECRDLLPAFVLRSFSTASEADNSRGTSRSRNHAEYFQHVTLAGKIIVFHVICPIVGSFVELAGATTSRPPASIHDVSD